MRTCRDLKGAIVGWVRLLGGSVTMSKGGFVRVSVKAEFAVTLKGEMNEKEMNLKGQANQDDDLQIHLIMKRVAELP